MIKLNQIESKYLEVLNETISIKDFETWVYNSELIIKKDISDSIYEDLIILNYDDRNAKYNIKKTISIRHRKLEKYQLQKTLIILLESSKIELRNISDNLMDSHYDPHGRMSFFFKANSFDVRLNNPFNFRSKLYQIEKQKLHNDFKMKFGNPRNFFFQILKEMNNPAIRYVIEEELEDVDPNDYTEAFCGQKNDININIDQHHILIDKNELHNLMNKYWL